MNWALLLLTAGIPLYLFRLQIGPVPTTLWELGLGLTFVIALYRKEVTLDFWKRDPLRWPILLFMVASTIAIVTSPHLTKALGQWKALAIDPLLFYWLVRSSLARTPHLGRWLVWALIASGGIVSLHALGDWARGITAVDGRVIGIYAADEGASPNYLALYLGPLAALAFGQLLQARAQAERWAMSVCFLLLVAGVVASQSRGALAGLALAVVIGGTAWLAKVWPGYRKAVVAVAVAAMLVAGVIFVPRFLPDLGANQSAGGRLVSSNNVRYQIWRTTVKIVLPQSGLLGLGWANYQDVFTTLTRDRVNYPEYIAPLALHPHNFWLTTLVTLGALGLLAWLWFVRILVRIPWQPALPLWLALIPWFIHGLVDTTYYKNDLAAEFFLIIALMVMYFPKPLRSPNP